MKKKIVAPIVITILVVLYAIGISVFLFEAAQADMLPPIAIIVLLASPVIAAILIIVVLIQRIKEIKGGEEDAASKY